MKRRYKLILIILIGGIITIFINKTSITKKVSISSFGDGLSIGMTPYGVAGSSFNDYLKEEFLKRNNLESYNNDFSKEDLTIHELNEYLDNNEYGKYSNVPIKQIIAKSDLITIAIGIDELANKTINKKLEKEDINNYLNEISMFLMKVREFYEKDIILIGVYPVNKLDKKDAIEINAKLQIICGKYNTKFLDIIAISLQKDYYLKENNYYLNYLAHQKIAKLVYKMYK